ncbi:unnamed protein product, partial [Larinioides sclopetarius]
PASTKHITEQQPGPAIPSRPTVIYFNSPKNGLGEMEVNSSVSNPASIPDPQQAKTTEDSYIRQSYGNVVNEAAFGYVYGVSQRSVKRNEHLIRDIMSGRKQITAECSTHQHPFLQSPLPQR